MYPSNFFVKHVTFSEITNYYPSVFITVLTPADESNHVDKHKFNIPFVCGAKDLGEALRRISEGAAMIRTKGEAGTGRFWRFFLYKNDGNTPPISFYGKGT